MRKRALKLFCLLLLVLFFVACVTSPVEIEYPSDATMSGEELVQANPESDLGEDSPAENTKDLVQIQNDARYIFEQMILPQALLANELETLGVISLMYTAGVEKMHEFLLLLWEFATANVIWEELIERQGEEFPASEEEFFRRANELRSVYGLGDEHIVDVALEEIDAETSAFIVQLLDINAARRSTYVGIAYNEAMGLRIFTLEATERAPGAGVDAHMFCFVGAGYRGSFHIIENNRQAFIDSIREAMNELIEPGATIGRPMP